MQIQGHFPPIYDSHLLVMCLWESDETSSELSHPCPSYNLPSRPHDRASSHTRAAGMKQSSELTVRTLLPSSLGPPSEESSVRCWRLFILISNLWVPVWVTRVREQLAEPGCPSCQ